MASNAKSRARSEANRTKADSKFAKILADFNKILSSGETYVRHYIPSGQAYTTLKNEVGAAKIRKSSD